MASAAPPHFEAEIIVSATGLPRIWLFSRFNPWASAAIIPSKTYISHSIVSSTNVDLVGNTRPSWDETLIVPFYSAAEKSTLFIDIFHADSGKKRKIDVVIARTNVALKEIIKEVGFGEWAHRCLKLTDAQFRQVQGMVELKIKIRQNSMGVHDHSHAPLPQIVKINTNFSLFKTEEATKNFHPSRTIKNGGYEGVFKRQSSSYPHRNSVHQVSQRNVFDEQSLSE